MNDMSIRGQIGEATDLRAEVLEFRDWFQSSLEQGVNGTAFMPISVLHNRLEQGPRLKLLLRDILPSSRVDLDTVKQNYKAVLAILILCEQPGYIEHFAKYPNLGDDKLPFYTKPDYFPTDTLWSLFSEHQWKFCAHVFHGRAHTELDPKVIVPFLRKETIGKGGTAEVFRVTIHPDYDHLKSETAASAPRGCSGEGLSRTPPVVHAQSPKYYALKTFHLTGIRARVLYEAEKDAFYYFKSAGAQTNTHNIIAFHAGFVQSDSYNILLEYAEHGTLEDFFQAQDKLPSGKELFPLWKAMSNLLNAVQLIHDVPPSDDLADRHKKVIFHGWHQDIKPGNILVVSDPENKGQYIFKLADFGSSHFRSLTMREEQLRSYDLEDKDSRGTKAYGAPECYRGNIFHVNTRVVGQSCDIWSLGCIYCEVVIWTNYGKAGLESFRQMRKQATDAIDGHEDSGCFHDRQHLLPCVNEALNEASQEARGTDAITKLIVSDLLPRMLCERQRRLTARFLSFEFDDIFAKAQPPPPRTVFKGRFSSANHHENSTSHQRLNEMRIASLQHGTQNSDASATGHPEENTAARLRAGTEQLPALSQPNLSIDARRDGKNSGTSRYRENGGGDSNASSQERDYTAPQRVETMRLASDSSAAITLTLSAVEEKMDQDKRSSIFKSRRKRFASLLADIDTTRAIQHLGGRDHLFLIDDSMSMDQYWSQVVRLTKALCWLVSGDDDDGIEIKFLRSPKHMKHFQDKGTGKLTDFLDKAKRDGESDINKRLSDILESYRDRYESWNSGKKRPSKRLSLLAKLQGSAVDEIPKKLSVYVLTNAVWQRRSDAAESIIPMVNKLEEWQRSSDRIGIQFISFGDDPDCIAKLIRLDKLKRYGVVKKDIVDHERSTGCLRKMIMGAIDKKEDRDSDSENDEETQMDAFSKT